MNSKTIKPIAYIKTDYDEKFGVPRQSGRAKHSLGEIIFYNEYRDSSALKEICGFSHLWLLFDFSLCKYDKFSPTVRPPRLGGNKRVGVFASRAPFRPNGIGLSCVKLVSINRTENFGDTLIVSGADLVNNTPIYDIKPYLPSTDCVRNAKGGYADQFSDYKVRVKISKKLLKDFPKEKIKALTECLQDDPRPSYQDDGKEYGLSFCGFNITFMVIDSTLTVTNVIKI